MFVSFPPIDFPRVQIAERALLLGQMLPYATSGHEEWLAQMRARVFERRREARVENADMEWTRYLFAYI